MIYIVKEERDGGLIKIGYAKSDVEGRVSDMQTGNPILLTILNVIPGTRRDEAKLHRRFRLARVYVVGGGRARGEWFKPVDDLMELINSLPPYPFPVMPTTNSPIDF